MPIVAEVGRRSWKVRLIFIIMYAILAILGVTMVYPFLITLTSSTTNAMDYNRFAPLPRALWSRQERFTRGIVQYYPEGMRNAIDEFSHQFNGVPDTWTAWQAIGLDETGIPVFADAYLAIEKDPDAWERAQKMAQDYSDFSLAYNIEDSICSFNERHMAQFFRAHYNAIAREQMRREGIRYPTPGQVETRALSLIADKWSVPFDNFFIIKPGRELTTPWDQQNYWPLQDGRAQDFAVAREAYRDRFFLPKAVKAKWYQMLRGPETRTLLGIEGTGPVSLASLNKALGTEYRSFSDVPFAPDADAPQPLQALWARYVGTVTPACETRPFSTKALWFRYLNSVSTRERLGIKEGSVLTIEEYNQVFGTSYASLRATPFPIPDTAPSKLKENWQHFVQTAYPMRLMEIRLSPALQVQYSEFIKERLKGDIERANNMLGTNYTSWNDFVLTARMPYQSEQQSSLWMEFVGKQPYEVKIPHSAEVEFQHYIMNKYGTLEAVNQAYGWHLDHVEQIEMPFDMAYLVNFAQNERPLFLASITENFAFVLDYLILRGRAMFNTIVLVVLTLLAALTVNPLAAYALSRFQMRQTPAIILFMLATMAFPAAVTMIPGYLLMRDLHLLNTYAALVLPSIANGMSIFLLKGFFDSLPPELYEAAALDGAQEWQMFLRITLPLSKPILAVIALNSFLFAYNSWEWALVVCQKQEMWTLAVWVYQFNTLWSPTQPWAVMASFIVASLPVFIVFLFCQNIILRGIILPQMK
jgi:ABC-type glycerol-3-phosphate transport system permease component